MSIILEVVADRDLHIWHVIFGLNGSNNDLNMLDRSPFIHNMLTSEARDMSFQVNGSNYDHYYLQLMEYIWNGHALFKAFMNLKTKKMFILRSGKKSCKKMLNDVSVFYKRGLRFSKFHPGFGAWISLQTSYSHVVSSIS
jgi:hypothetical protein